jgi:hypothetical protein
MMHLYFELAIGGGFCIGVIKQHLVSGVGSFHLQVNTIQQWTGETLQITLNGIYAATTPLLLAP